MISVTFTSDVENIVATEHLYQWDNGQKLSISGVGTTADIHFANKKSEKALVVTPTITSGAMVAFIPNSLLAEPYPILAYVYVPSDDGARTLKTVTIAVEARKQPSDFVLDEDEGITTLESISQRVNEMIQSATNQINTAVSNMQTDYTNFKNTIQGELADMVANTTIPNADTVDGLHANEIASNPNLLINPDFKINQRGLSEYTSGDTVDRWSLGSNQASISVGTDGISITSTYDITSNTHVFWQRLEFPLPPGKYTLSVNVKEVTGLWNARIRTETADGTYASSYYTPALSTGVNKVSVDLPENEYISAVSVGVNKGTKNGDSVKIEWMKLEPGSNTTQFVPPNHTEELLKIQAKDGTIHAKTADTAETANTANTAGTLATTPTNVCLRNISFGTAQPQITNPNADGYVAPGALYAVYE